MAEREQEKEEAVEEEWKEAAKLLWASVIKSFSVILEQQSQNDHLDFVIAWFWALSGYPNSIHISEENTYHQHCHNSSDYRQSLK